MNLVVAIIFIFLPPFYACQSDADWVLFIQKSKPDCDWMPPKLSNIMEYKKAYFGDLTYNEQILYEKCLMLWLSFKEALREPTQDANFTKWREVLFSPPINWIPEDTSITRNYGINFTANSAYLYRVEPFWDTGSVYVKYYLLLISERYLSDKKLPQIWLPELKVVNVHSYYSDIIQRYRHTHVDSNGNAQSYYSIEAPASCELDYSSYPTDEISCKLVVATTDKWLRFQDNINSTQLRTYDREKNSISKEYEVLSSAFQLQTEDSKTGQIMSVILSIKLKRRSDVKWIELFTPLCVSMVLTMVSLAYPNKSVSFWVKLLSLLIMAMAIAAVGGEYEFVSANSVPRILNVYQLVVALTLISMVTNVTVSGIHRYVKHIPTPLVLKKSCSFLNRLGYVVHENDNDGGQVSLLEESTADPNSDDWKPVISAIHVAIFYTVSAVFLISLASVLYQMQ